MIDHEEERAFLIGLVAWCIWTLACVGVGLLLGVVVLGGWQ